MATKKGAKKGAASKKSTRSKEASPAAQPGSPGAAGQPDLDMKIDLMEMTTAPCQTVDQHPRPVIPPLFVTPLPFPPIRLDECGAGTFTSFDNETVTVSKAGVTGKKPGFTHARIET